MNIHFLCNEAEKIGPVEYLEIPGFRPEKIRNNDYSLRCSLLREEKTQSFKINRKLNVWWYYYGLGTGGRIIEFRSHDYHYPIPELLQKLNDNFSFHQQIFPLPESSEKATSIKLRNAIEIKSLNVQNYLIQRSTPIETASLYSKQIRYDLKGRFFTAIGLKTMPEDTN